MKFKEIFTLKTNIETNTNSITEANSKITSNAKSISEVERINGLQNEAFETLNDSMEETNTSVESLKTTVENNSNDISVIKTSLSSLETKSNTNETNITNLETKITTVESTIGDLNDEVVLLKNNNKSPFKGKVWTALGDSLTMTTSDNSLKHTPNGRGYLYWVNQKLEFETINNMGLDSSTISTVRTSPENFIQRMINIPANSDLITVFGGYNDMWSNSSKLGTIDDTDTTTIYGALNKIARYLLCTYPKAIIVFFTTLHWTWEREGSSANPPYVVNPNGLTTALLNQAIRDIGNKYSIPVIDLEKNSGIFTGTFNQETGVAVKFPHFYRYSYDGLHLNERGHQKIAKYIVSELLKIERDYEVIEETDTSAITITDPSETGTSTAIAWATKYTEKSSSSGGTEDVNTVQVPLNVASANFSYANDNSSTVTNWTVGYSGLYSKSMSALGIEISTDASVVGEFTLKGTDVDGIEIVSSSVLANNSSGETEIVAVQGDTSGSGNFYIAFRLSHTRLGIDDDETDSAVMTTKMQEFIANSDWYLEFNSTGTGGSTTDPEEPTNYIDISVATGASYFTYSYDNQSEGSAEWTIGCACPYPMSQSALGITIDTDASVIGDFTLVGTDCENITVTSSSILGANSSEDIEQVAVQGTSDGGFYLAFRLSHTRLGIDDSEIDTDVMLTKFKEYLASCDWVLRFTA